MERESAAAKATAASSTAPSNVTTAVSDSATMPKGLCSVQFLGGPWPQLSWSNIANMDESCGSSLQIRRSMASQPRGGVSPARLSCSLRLGRVAKESLPGVPSARADLPDHFASAQADSEVSSPPNLTSKTLGPTERCEIARPSPARLWFIDFPV